MKTIEVDEQIYRYIASRTLHIGESASDILRRLLALPLDTEPTVALGHEALGGSADRATELGQC